jgi:hypothetical protein
LKLKLITSLVVLLANMVCCALLIVVLLIVMNGYSESDALWGFGGFVLLSMIVAIATAAVGFILTGVVSRRGFRKITAFGIAATGPIAAGIVLQSACAVIGVLISEFVRTTF